MGGNHVQSLFWVLASWDIWILKLGFVTDRGVLECTDLVYASEEVVPVPMLSIWKLMLPSGRYWSCRISITVESPTFLFGLMDVKLFLSSSYFKMKSWLTTCTLYGGFGLAILIHEKQSEGA